MKNSINTANYTVDEPGRTTTFKGKPLIFKKCLQIMRLSENGKKWKGFELISILFVSGGLKEIHIKGNRKVIFNKNQNGK